MPLRVSAYFNISEKAEELRSIYYRHGSDALFIVPAGLDRDTLTDLICAETSFFGVRPAVYTIGDLLGEFSRITGSRVRIIDPPDHHLILEHLLEEYIAEREAKGALIAPGLRYRGFISLLGSNIKDLLSEEVTPEKFSSSLFGGEEPDPSRPEAILLCLYRRYMDYLKEYDLADAAQIPTLARAALNDSRVIEFVKNKKFIFTGFLSFNGAQLKFVRALAEASELLMFQPETGLDDFYDGIRQLDAEYSGRPEWDVPAVRLEAVSDILEAESAAREIALWAKGKGVLTAMGKLDNFGEIGIYVPKSSLKLIEYALSRYKIAYSVRARGTVAETLAGELFSMVRRAFSSGFDNYNTSLLLENPLLFPEADGGLESTRCHSSLPPEGAKEWAGALRGDDRKRFAEICDFCRELYGKGKKHTPLEALSMWLAFLKKCRVAEAAAYAAAGECGLDGEVRDVSYTLHELEKKIMVLENAANSVGPAADISLDGAEAAAFIEDWAATATLPIQLPQRRSLSLYAGMPPTLTEHKYWFIMGADGNTWPGVMRESLLLRNEYKEKFNAAQLNDDDGSGSAPHLPEIREERERREAVFRRLAATGRSGIVFCRSLYDESQKQVPASQFVTSMLKDEPQSRRRWRLAAAVRFGAQNTLPDGNEPVFAGAEVSGMRFARGREFVKPAGFLRQSAEKPVVSVSDIDIWRVCPYRYWCERHLRLEVPGAADLFDRRAGGVLSHKVWEQAFGEKKKNPNMQLFPYVMNNWDRIKDEVYPEIGADRRLARFESGLKREIFDLASFQDDIEAQEPLQERQEVKTEYRLCDHEVDGVIFRAKADRIDIYKEGAVILDYKLGKSDTHTGDLQVPAYAVILRASGTDILGFGWIGQRDCSLSGYFSTEELRFAYEREPAGRSKYEPGELMEQRMEEAETVMTAMAAAVKKGVYEPKYSHESALCINCQYFTLCRKRDMTGYAIDDDDDGESSDE